jgi:hypothetical protein
MCSTYKSSSNKGIIAFDYTVLHPIAEQSVKRGAEENGRPSSTLRPCLWELKSLFSSESALI